MKCQLLQCQKDMPELRKMGAVAICRRCWQAIDRANHEHNRRYQYDDRFAQRKTPEWTTMEKVS